MDCLVDVENLFAAPNLILIPGDCFQVDHESPLSIMQLFIRRLPSVCEWSPPTRYCFKLKFCLNISRQKILSFRSETLLGRSLYKRAPLCEERIDIFRLLKTHEILLAQR